MRKENLKNARIERGLRLRDLSRITGINENSLSRFEKGKREPTFEQVIELAYTLEVSIYHLLNSSDKHYGTLQKFERVT